MMRSLYSGVSGLKTHQTKMDVIGNNIANVNTVAYKSQSITFSDLMYQTTQSASGPNATTGAGGINARQIGLGVKSAAINTSITTAGSTQTTGNPFDIKINGDAFFIVNNGTENYFTRDGSFYVDAAGNLAMTSNGYNVMGWQVDDTTGMVKQDTVSALRIISEANMTYPPEATTEAYISGLCDKNDTDINSTAGKAMNLNFYDTLGYSYTAKLSVHSSDTDGEYYVQLDDILDSKTGESLVDVYGVRDISDIATFGGTSTTTKTELMQLVTGASYVSADKKFYQNVALEEAFSDFAANKISGVTYEPKSAITTVNAGDPVTMTGTGTVTRKVLEDVYGLVYVQPTDGSTPYYYQKDEITGTGQKVDSDTVWKTVLGINSLTGTQAPDGDGNITITVEQDFTVGITTGTYDTASKTFKAEITAEEAYGVDTTDQSKTYSFDVAPDGQAQVTTTTKHYGNLLKYNTENGNFISINNAKSALLDFNASATTLSGKQITLGNFSDINVDFSGTTQQNNGGTSTLGANAGTLESNGSLGCGRKLGEMSGVSIAQNGEIYASYDNGMSKLLGQIAVATFANASGLEKQGDNLYSATQNSGEFDGIGQDITADGTGSLTTGALEMSNVDLSSEFTEMITTQRGFQANSRIITVSDTLLEELINLKR